DLNATRARAVAGIAESSPQPLLLGGTSHDLPLALSLENRHIEVGAPGLALCRRLPHLACLDFLGHLGTDRQWSAGRHRLNAGQALGLVFDHVRSRLSDHHGVALAVPAYLSVAQAEILTGQAARSKLSLFGLVATPLAAALIAHA